MVRDVIIPSSTVVRNLGVLIDANLSMRAQVDLIVSKCFLTLRHLRSVRRYVSSPVIQSMVTSLVISRLDYCNGVLFGLPAVQMRRLQSVQNAAARLIFNLRRYDHITDALVSLHWLRFPERVVFKLAVLVYRAIHGTAPAYLSTFTTAAAASRRSGLRSSSSSRLLVPRFKCSTIGARSFPVAGATVWNNLPADITSSPSLTIFRHRLKTHLFSFSYPNAV